MGDTELTTLYRELVPNPNQGSILYKLFNLLVSGRTVDICYLKPAPTNETHLSLKGFQYLKDKYQSLENLPAN